MPVINATSAWRIWVRPCLTLWLFILTAASASAQAQLQFEFQPERAGLSVTGFTPAQLNSIDKRFGDADQLDQLLQVFVQGNSTPLLADVIVDDQKLVLKPRFPFADHVKYIARLAIDEINGQSGLKPMNYPFSFESEANPIAPTRLVAVYPSGDQLPQNILKMYLEFSQPMSRGEAYDRIRFFEDSGTEILEPFIRIEPELWTVDGKRFTLLFDPGRIKRELRPNRELGPPFLPDRKYKLVVDRAWRDASGRPLATEFEKAFSTLAPDRKQPDPLYWQINIPQRETLNPLTVKFDEPLDRAMLDHALRLTDSAGKPVSGEQRRLLGETGWMFTPANAWRAGTYTIEIDGRLEDRAGNSVEKPFEVRIDKDPSATAPITELTFTVR